MMQPTRFHPARLLPAALLALVICAPAHALDAGEPAPAIEVSTATGQPLKIAAQPGKVLYVDFWASWCGPCRQSFPWMNSMQAKCKDRGLQIVGINLDAEAADAQQFLSKIPAEFTIAYDPKGSSALQYGVKGMPTSLLIGPDGKVIRQHMGFNNEARDELEQEFQKILGSAK